MTDLTQEDVHAAKDVVIQMLTNQLLRAEAELAALRRLERMSDVSDRTD